MTGSDNQPCTRDVIVVGASAGGVEALRELAASLPADLPAAMFVTIHRGNGPSSYLPDILDAAGPLDVEPAEEGARFVRGRIYVAPPDRHLLVGRNHIHVRRGPRENRVRPAIDPLFRSAAVNCSVRVIGILLTGMLDDGTAGCLAIRRCGGVTVVQDPSTAAYAAMPRSAIAHAAADHVRPLCTIPPLLAELARQPCAPPVEVPERLRIEALIAAQELHMDPDQNRLGTLAPLTCPECHGSMYEIRDDGFLRFRCHTGHSFTAESLREAQLEAWEQALYDALRAQEEQLVLVRRMAGDAQARGKLQQVCEFEQRARSYEEGAEIIRRMIADGPIGFLKDSTSRGTEQS
ncbi:chemotaxis protein CheB [Benzoatithermus flavus]|uniref:protein-glutamate methylesterase n=1 Tax=Benzoatithermus flavus TaxID=3108223 RepID=A0ABU8XTI3_9PROT